jgi:Raf kinase inhibitor-like YbhB/YbcL family protein
MRGHGSLAPAAWSNAPAEARSLALTMLDPDAPGGTFTHWIAWGLDPQAAGLAEGEAVPVEGRNDFGTVGYRGPCPPSGHGRHRYVFRLFALDADLELTPRAPPGRSSSRRSARTRSRSLS